METKETPSAQYAITMRLECPHQAGWIAKVTSVIAEESGTIRGIDLVHIERKRSLRDYSIECSSTEQAARITDAVKRMDGVVVHSVSDNTFLRHLGGKLEVISKGPLKTRSDLSMIYTPGVARVCMAIDEDQKASFNLTIRKNCVAVVSDGSAVLGLGNIGPYAAMPVMEGKAILFKEFGGVDAFPLCIATQDADEIIRFCKQIAPTFGGINLEDIMAPKCFYVEKALKAELDIPVFHDDQHGTAIVVLAGVMNALKLTGKSVGQMKLVVSGAGAAAIACVKMLRDYGIANIVVCDSKGAIYRGRDVGTNTEKVWVAENTNPRLEKGMLSQVIAGADMFLGLSVAGALTRKDVERMNKQPIVFAMANPTPEVLPEEVEDIVAVMATGRSDYPNQINNVLAFPGIFRGALDARARDINEEMKHTAAIVIAEMISEKDLSPDYIVPSVFNRDVAKKVAAAVAQAAYRSGVAQRSPKGMLLGENERAV